MNIIYIHPHDTGSIIEPNGHPIPTPDLMRLAGASALFRSIFRANPTCCASRASLLAGTAKTVRDEVFAEVGYAPAGSGWR